MRLRTIDHVTIPDPAREVYERARAYHYSRSHPWLLIECKADSCMLETRIIVRLETARQRPETTGKRPGNDQESFPVTDPGHSDHA